MLKEVVKFEVVRSLKKPSFWVAAILLPVLLVGYIFFAGFSGASAEKALSENGDLGDKKLSLMDESGIIDDKLLDDVQLFENKNDGVESVKRGEVDAFYFVPADLTQKIEIYNRSDNDSVLTNYQGKIDEWLKVSVLEGLTEPQIIVMTSSYQVETFAFNAEGEDNALGRMIVPFVALAIFYVLICIFGNRLTTATIEEKENRITEMILTSISAKTLIVGKIISLISLGFLQVFILMLPIILIFVFVKQNNIGGLDLAAIIPNIELNPLTILTSVILLFLGYILFVGLCVFVGTLVPTAKEVSSYASVMMILVILPMFFLSSFLVTTPDMMTYVLTYFPFSAPIALFLRFAFGTLQWWEMVIGLVVIAVSAAVIIRQAIKVFQFGAVSLSKINLKDAFFRK